MKRILIIVFSLFSIFTNAQTLSHSDIYIYENSFAKVYNSDINVDTKFGNASLWVARSFKDYDRVVQYEDKTNHRLILKSTNAGTKVSFSITVDCRDEKYRITAEGIAVDGIPYEKYIAAIPARIANIDEKINSLNLEYETAIDKWEKAQKTWKPMQLHYKIAKEEFDLVNNQIQTQHQYLNKSKQELLLVETLVKETVAEVFNSFSSAISYVDEF